MENHWLVLVNIKGEEASTESREPIPTPITWAFVEIAGDELIKMQQRTEPPDTAIAWS